MKNRFLSSILFLGASLVVIGSADAAEYDRYGRIVKTDDGVRVLYSESDPIPSEIQLNRLEPDGPKPLSIGDGFSQLVQNDSYLKYTKASEYVVWGTYIGQAGMQAMDIDRDGMMELLLTCYEHYWYIVKHSQLRGGYEIIWSSEVYSESIAQMAAFEINNKIFVFLGFEDGTLKIIDGDALAEIGSVKPFNDTITAICYGDADNDGTNEVLVCNQVNTVMYDPLNSFGVPERTLDYGSYDMKVGNVDRDPYIEIVYTSGDVIEVTNDTVSLQWSYPDQFGHYLELVDVDADGMEEIVGAEAWYMITCFDGDVKSAKWQHEADRDVNALRAYDVDADGDKEILYGDGQWGNIHCLDSATGEHIWQIGNPEHGTTDIGIADIDGDHRPEIYWSGGYSSSGEDIFFVCDLHTRNREWGTSDITPPFLAFDSADLDGDGVTELVTASKQSNSSYDNGILFQVNGLNHEIEWQSDVDLFDGYMWDGIHSLVATDYDYDGQEEVLVGGSGYNAKIYIIDPIRRAQEKYIEFEHGDYVSRLKMIDVDGDDIKDLIVEAGYYIYIVEPVTETIKWTSIMLDGGMRGFEVGNIDADSSLEIVVPHGRMITVIDGTSYINYTLETDENIVSSTLVDMNADGLKDILCIYQNGDMRAYTGTDYSEISVANLGLNNGYVKAMTSADIDKNGVDELVIHVGSSYYSYWGIGDSWLLIRRSDNMGIGYDIPTRSLPDQGNNERIYFSDLNSDGFPEMVLGTRRGWSVWNLEGANSIDPTSLFQPIRVLSNGWKQSSWFGYYNDGDFPSVSHPALGKFIVRKDSAGRYLMNSSSWGELEMIQPGSGEALYVWHKASRTNFLVCPTNEEFALLGPGRFYDHTFGKWVDNIIPNEDDYPRFYEIAEYLVRGNQGQSAEIVALANGGQVGRALEQLQEMMICHNTIIDYCNRGINAVDRLIPYDAYSWRISIQKLINAAESSIIVAQQAIQANS